MGIARIQKSLARRGVIRYRNRVKLRDDQNQPTIDWASPQAAGLARAAAAGFPDPIKLNAQCPQPLVQRLPWDFSTTFPQPTDEAVDAGALASPQCSDVARLEVERARLAELSNSAIELFAGSFGQEAAERLDYAHRQVLLRASVCRVR